MLTINEIRIGNLVNYSDNILEVIALSKNNLMLQDFKECLIIASDDLLKGIPLTDENIRLLGFDDNDFEDGYIGIDIKVGNWNTDLPLLKPTEDRPLYVFELKFGGIPFIRNLSYIHELQNLYNFITCSELDMTSLIEIYSSI